jgi:endonuclease III
LGDYNRVRHYGDAEVQRAMSDPEMFCHETNIRACIQNAQRFSQTVHDFGTFRAYLLSFEPWDSYAGVDRLCRDLLRFRQVGPKSAQHFANWCRFPVVKTDRHIMRIFSRIGLVSSDGNEAGTIQAARKMSEAAGVGTSAIDSFVGMGLEDYYGKGSQVCATEPNCGRCHIGDLCQYQRKHGALARR